MNIDVVMPISSYPWPCESSRLERQSLAEISIVTARHLINTVQRGEADGLSSWKRNQDKESGGCQQQWGAHRRAGGRATSQEGCKKKELVYNEQAESQVRWRPQLVGYTCPWFKVMNMFKHCNIICHMYYLQQVLSENIHCFIWAYKTLHQQIALHPSEFWSKIPTFPCSSCWCLASTAGLGLKTLAVVWMEVWGLGEDWAEITLNLTLWRPLLIQFLKWEAFTHKKARGWFWVRELVIFGEVIGCWQERETKYREKKYF